MMDNGKDGLFLDHIYQAISAFKNLATIHAEMQLKLNKLNSGLRKQMEIISEIEEGWDNNGEDSISLLTKEITEILSVFNEEMEENISLFKMCIQDSISHYKKALTFYSNDKSELSELLKARKTLLYLVALMTKFRMRVIAVSSSLKVLPALTKETKIHKKLFAEEAKRLIVELNNGGELCSETANEIEKALQSS